jgi:hypothetical protein
MLRELTMIFENSHSISISGNVLRIVKARFLPQYLLPNDGSALGVLGFLTCNAAINKLLNGSSLVAQQKTIMLKLNGTSYSYNSTYPNLRTNQSGYAWLALYLSPQANNNQTAYSVVVSFAGDSASTATALLTTLNGTTYDVCTTTQYNSYEPSSNSTSITVTPQTTRGATTLVDTAAMQQKAESKGVLKVSTKFSLCFPWITVVAEVNVPFESGVTTFRSELMPLAFSQITDVVSGAEWFIQDFGKVVAKIGVDVIAGYILTILLAKATAWAFGSSSLPGLLLAIIVYAAVTLGVTAGLNLLFGKSGLLVGIVSFFIALSIGLVLGWVKGQTAFLYSFLRGLYVGASTGSIESMWHSWWGSSMNFLNIVSTAAFYFVDLGLAAGLAVWL